PLVTAINDDLFAPEFMQERYETYRRWRTEDPVHWNNLFQTWEVSRYDDVVWALRHPELFSSDWLTFPKPTYPPIQGGPADAGGRRKMTGEPFIFHDRPRHANERGTVHSTFTPRAIQSWRPLVQRAIRELLDGVQERGHMDLVADFAAPLPVLVICKMLGV